MSYSKTDTQPPFDRADKARSGRLVILMIALLLLVAGVGAVAFWSDRGQLSEQTRMANVPATAQPDAPPLSSGVAASDDAIQSLNALKQTVKELGASGQEMGNRLDELKRKLANEQGERKMLVQQVGALSGRVDGLSAAASSGPTGSTVTPTPQSAQKKKKSNTR
jgi:hypothetical protein